jgi:hypothetical protein
MPDPDGDSLQVIVAPWHLDETHLESCR